MTQVEASARRASNSRAVEFGARVGLAARGFIYLVIAWLAIQIAMGHSSHQANQRGALAEVASQPLGSAILWLLAFGFLGYALWRLCEAAFGTAAEGKKTGARLKSLVRGVIYLAFAITTFLFIAGQPQQSQNQKQQTATAQLLHQSFGQWLVGIAGLVVIGVGVGMIVEGVRKKFLKDLELAGASAATRRTVERLGMVGTIARGAAFAIIGGLVVDAAITYDPKKSSGLDGALRTLAQNAFGEVILWLIALGLVAFGIYGFAAAKWAKVGAGGSTGRSR